MAIAIGVLAAIGATAVYLYSHREHAPARAHAVTTSVIGRPRIDPAALRRGSIAGTVRTAANQPVAFARVCVDGWSEELPDELFRTPSCVVANAGGAYRIAGLLPASYVVSAIARGFEPANTEPVVVGDGEAREGVDVVIVAGGGELTGTVEDVAGGPIAHAQIVVRRRGGTVKRDAVIVTTETDDQGRFTTWFASGYAVVSATADGYAAGSEGANVPGNVQLQLTPESSLRGRVVDAASGEPVSGAYVAVVDDYEHELRAVSSEADGSFEVAGLAPSRVRLIARTERGYARSAGSIAVGMAEHVDGIVLALQAAHQVVGTLRVASATCERGGGTLYDPDSERSIALRRVGDAWIADGVPAGRYVPRVWCRGALPHAAYDPIVVDRDVTGLVWELDAGVTLRGKVVTRSGVAVPDASIIDDELRAYTRSRADGSYVLVGVTPGARMFGVRSDRAIAETRYDLVIEGDLEHDFVLDDAGAVTGTIVDRQGRPVGQRRIQLALRGDDYDERFLFAASAADGTFAIRPALPGRYRVVADGVTPTELVVVANQTTTVRLEAAVDRVAVTGRVVDDASQPLADAYVIAAPDDAGNGRDAVRWGDGKIVLTDGDGRFAFADLVGTAFTLRAYRTGGGEVFADHVAPNADVTLRIPKTAQVAGTIREANGALASELAIEIADDTAVPVRTERFFACAGHYELRDLRAGSYTVLAKSPAGRKQSALVLRPGDHATLDLTLEPLLAITGRAVDLRTGKPVAGASVKAYADAASPTLQFSSTAVTDRDGRFRIARVPLGVVELSASQQSADYEGAKLERTITINGPFDVGDLPMLQPRATGDDIGDPGFSTKRDGGVRVTSVDDDGPATGRVREGDVIVTVDGIDVRGGNAPLFEPAIQAPPGTRVVLGLARGGTVTITLGAPDEEDCHGRICL